MKNRFGILIFIILIILLTPIYACAQFTYLPPGDLISGSGSGRIDYNVYVPGIRFPIEISPAYANSQVYNPGGQYGGGGSQCDSSNYNYPWRDNYCETRSWNMPMCPSGTGHQGQDIRPPTCEKDKYWVVSVSDGTVTDIGSYWISITASDGTIYDYIHMRNVIVNLGERIIKGQRLGMVSDNMGSTPTTIHLHFNIMQNVINLGGYIYVPTYMSLVKAYENLIGSVISKLTITTSPASFITITSATLNGTVTNDGGSTILERRFDWGATPDGAWPSTNWTNQVNVSGNNFSYNLTGLNPNTTYYFRPWAQNSAGWSYGSIMSLITLIASDTTPPTVTAFDVRPKSLTLGNLFNISYTVSDTGGSGLKQVELWRALDDNNNNNPDNIEWTQIGSSRSLSGNNPVSGSFSDTPSLLGIYWYGAHILDNAGNMSVEPNPPGPIKIIVNPVADTTISNITFLPSLEGGRISPTSRSFTMIFYDAGTSTKSGEFTATSDTSGKITLPINVLLTAGTYDIMISSPYFLRKKALSYNLSSNITVTLPALLAGDLNNDGIINSLDWSIMSPRWFTNDPIADINRDGLVNSIDFSIMSKNWFKMGD